MKHKTPYIYLLPALLFLLLAASEASAELMSAQQMFAPLEYINLANAYDHYSAVIDLFIYGLIFIGVAQVTLGPRFAGRGGKAICAGVGISLAVSMAIAERQFGFSLKSFGPIAAGIIILLLGIMVYHLLHQAGLSKTGALSISYAGMFLTVHGAAPKFVGWLQSQMPFVYLLALLGLLASLYFAFTSLRPEVFRQHRFEERLREAKANEPERKHARETVKKEEGFIKRFLKPGAKHALKESVEIEDDLQSVANAIKKNGHNPEARPVILQRMGEIVPKGQQFLKTIQELREMTRRLLQADTELLGEKNKERLSAMTPRDKDLWSKELHDEVDRLGLEKKTGQLEEAIEDMVTRVGERLKKAGELLREGHIEEAWQEAQNALNIEKNASSIAHQLKKLEKTILSLARKDYRIERKLAEA